MNQRFLLKTALYNLYHVVLLFLGHFDVGGEAEAAGEDILVYGGVFNRNEISVLEHGLHMHRLPDGAAFYVRFVELIVDIHRLYGAVLIQKDAGKPEVWSRIVEIGVHGQGKTLKCLGIAAVYLFL